MTDTVLTKPVQAKTLGLENITDTTPMGGNLLPSGAGATFRVWAPMAQKVSVCWQFEKQSDGSWAHLREGVMTKRDDDTWVGYVPRLVGGSRYMFYVEGPEGGTTGFKRDPFARDLTDEPMWPDCQCLLYNPNTFPWHDEGWHPPAFHDFCIYQLHIGTWYIPENRPRGAFLDVIERLPYLKSLNINAIQPLPIVEFPTMFSFGYNGVDYFSPETDYGISDEDLLPQYLDRINMLLADINPQHRPYELEHITGTANQFRMMVDMCHVFGIAVVLDVVYNHAGGDFGDKSMYFFDRQAYGDQNRSQYFTDQDWAGGWVFAYWKQEIKQFLIDNALFYLNECHCDGFRYDEVSVIKNKGGGSGWQFCQYVTDTSHFVKPEAIHIAECWPPEQAIVEYTANGGAGFDALQNDGLRDSVRGVIAQAAKGRESYVNLDSVAANLRAGQLRDSWRAVQCVENHDIVYRDRGVRLARLADGSDPHSSYASGRARVALGLVATAMGIPHIFMGQEILEDKQWNDEPKSPYQIWWEGLDQVEAMADFNAFTRGLLGTRAALPGLRGDGLNIFHIHNDNRILAFHRWVEYVGHDVVVVCSLNEETFWDYELGMPQARSWEERFNSAAFSNGLNSSSPGNCGQVWAGGEPRHGLPTSTHMVIPANSILIFS